MSEELKFLVDLAKTQASLINTLWNFYITVCLATLGWFVAAGADRLKQISVSGRWIIAAGFAVFTLVNALSLSLNYAVLGSALQDAQPLLRTQVPAAVRTAEAFATVAPTIWGPFGLPVSLLIQLLVGVLVCVLILRFGREPKP